ncbi:MAG: Flp pilus assembly complex ATPase component TadA [Candidatus Diapherotrites archaeon]|uniref:Flp pilus assembly complex ATPase component TadA n=1 Tax=Candidatus Iainarchaeum sp. TaxID=3101447 RepID=A0A939C6Y9_9ARCH|nr:Flp pilus assembly complex ATPase component TadA [Candidatus Diapherotrites archaeon]
MAEKDYLAELIKKVKSEKSALGVEGDEKKKQPVLGPELEKSFRQIREEKLAEEEKQRKVAEAAVEGKEVEEAIPEKSAVEQEIERAEEKKEIASYGGVKIYHVPGKALLYYFVPVARPTKSEKNVINTIKEAATRLISISPYKIREPEQRRAVYKQKILEILRSSPELHIPERRFEFYAESVVREMVGYGVIDPIVRDDGLEEIMVIGPNKPVYIFHREYEMMTTNIEFYNDQEIIDLINRIARQVGRRVDISSPLLDARLPDGSRVNATIAPASVQGATLTIRKFRKDPYSMIDLIKMNTVTAEVAAFLWLCVEGMEAKPANILIAGGTSSGKTTTLNCLASFIPERERVVTIEDTAELSLPLKHWVRLEARPPGLEGKGELTLDVLTKNSLRMRPDRVIVGEVRHDEAFTLFTALNTGHDGMASEDALIQFSDGSIRELGTFCEGYLAKLETKKDRDMEFAEIKKEAPEIIAISKENLTQQTARVKSVWKRECKTSVALQMASGKTIKVSYDHPVFRLKNGFLEQVQAHECEEGDHLCVMNSISVNGKKFGSEQAYFLGLLLGDGHLRHEGLFFENKNVKLHGIFRKLAKSLFGKKPKLYRRKDGRMSSQLHSVKIATEMHKKFDIPFGNKTRAFDIPKAVEESDNQSVGLFLRGLFDTDGHASSIRKSVCLATANPQVSKKVPLLLKRFGIESRVYKQEKDGRNNFGPYYRIFITGEGNLKKFKNFVGFGHQKKAQTLESIINVKENTNVDLVPDTGLLIKRVRKATGITKKGLGLKAGLGNTGSSINAYETNARSPSKAALRKINKALTDEFNGKVRKVNKCDPYKLSEAIITSPNKKAIKIALDFAKKLSTVEDLQKKSGLKNKLIYYYLKTGRPFKKEKLAEAVRSIYHHKTEELSQTRKLIMHINSLTSNSIMWDKIVNISQKEEKTNYYDLTLDKFNTYIANGIIVSNCMGTVHANSPQETIVRVTSPPMNVPEVMLSGLDLIVVEHKIHDKRRGTIRRITNISEVSGVLLKRAQTQTIYERDPVRDTIEKTTVPVKYLKVLQDFTGLSKSKIDQELEERAEFLNQLVKRNIRGMRESSKAAQMFLMENR